MRTRTTLLLLVLCLTGFVVALYTAGTHSGTDEGNLWLLTGVILGIAVISTSLAVIGNLNSERDTPAALPPVSPVSPDRYARRNHPEVQRPSPVGFEPDKPAQETREHHHSTAGRTHESQPR